MNLLDDLMFWWGPDRRRLGPLLVDCLSFEINLLSEINRGSHFGAYSHSHGHEVPSTEEHLTKSSGRGYNQSPFLSRNIADIT